MLGETISHYRILEKLGQGGMGEVWLAEDIRLGHEVAIKRLPVAAASDREARHRFQREAKAIAQLRHPNIVSLLEFDEIDGQFTLVAEYVRGGSLRDRLREGTLPLESVLIWGIQAATALAEAHRRGILHRDIKPDNLLLTEDDDLKVSDFGLARLQDDTRMTEAGSTMGTLSYCSPEQARGEDVDSRGDIFSLGATIYELLTGRPAFGGSSRVAILRAVLDDTPPPPSSLRNDVPPSLDRILGRLFEKDPALRPQSAEEVADELQAVAIEIGAGVTTPLAQRARITTGGFRQRGFGRRSWIVVIALALLGGTAAIVHFGPGPPEDPSLAVLPLANLSEGANHAYLASGMTEALIQEFGKIQTLKVIAHQSVRRYADSNETLPEIARDLGVTTVLEGSVMRFDENIRISVRVTDVDADELMVNRSFYGPASGILKLYGVVARTVADELRLRLSPLEQRRLLDQRAVNPDAYAEYLKGRHHWDNWTAPELALAVDYFERAVALDSTFARPHASLASAFSEIHLQGNMDTDEARTRALAAATRALELDPELSEANAAMGRVVFYFDWDFDRAEPYFLRAIDLNPNSSESHYQYATYLLFAGRGNESVTEMRRAVELDPLSHRRNSNLGWALVHARRYEEAIEHLQSSLELFRILPDSTEERWSHYLLAGSYRRAGRFEEALAEIDAWNLGRWERALVYIEQHRTADALALWKDRGDEVPARIWAATGNRERAMARVEGMKAQVAAGAQGLTLDIAAVYAILDEKDLAFEWLRRAYDARVQGLIFLPWATYQWNNLRDDPRFEALLADIRRGK